MSVRHVLLGLLLDRPAYPYQLGDRLEKRLGPAWALNSGQLYGTCKSLEKGGFIERVDSADDDQTDRHIYAITDAGTAEHHRWFGSEARRPKLLRRELLAKITIAGPNRLKDTFSEIDAYERECWSSLRDHQQRREALPLGSLRIRADDELLRLNLNATIRQLEAELDWIKEARERVVWLAKQAAIWPSTRLPAPRDRRAG